MTKIRQHDFSLNSKFDNYSKTLFFLEKEKKAINSESNPIQTKRDNENDTKTDSEMNRFFLCLKLK